ncbi:MAG TPA: DUF4136 domain-containing protein [Steroidobacteraceae bacterium]
MRAPIATTVLCAASLLMVACAAQTSAVRVDKAETGLPNCQSFAWNPSSGDAMSLGEQRVRGQVMQVLQSKGYTESADKPDCRISYRLASSTLQRSSGPSVGVGAVGGSGGVGGGIGISLPIGKKGQPGTFTLDVIDAAKNQQVWSGSIDSSFQSGDADEAETQRVVEKVLKEYPDRK